MASTNGVESFWALLKRGFYGTFHHFSKKHLTRYVDEFVFRSNEGNCRIDTIDHITAFMGCVAGRRITYANLING